uniref:Cytochrome P450 2G1-like n=1 Tax=Cyprinodon variegatus TaxID=28743 RepID=A0A3Q2FQG3_CYPVA
MEFYTTLLLAGLIGLIWFFSVKNQQSYRLPPGPNPLPLIGNLPQIDKNAPFKTFLELSKTYGPVMTLYLGWQRVVVLVGYDTVKEALVDQADDFTGRAPVPFLYKATKGFGKQSNFAFSNAHFCSTGIGISNGERWRQLRRFTLTTLRDFGMGRKGMEEWIQEESKHLRAQIRKYKGGKKNNIWTYYFICERSLLGFFLFLPPGKPFDPTILLSRTVSNVICCLVFGQRFSYEDKQFQNLLSSISKFIRFNSSPSGMLYNIFPSVMERLPGPHQSVFAGIDQIRDFIKIKIQEHKETLDPSSPRDFIDCFLIRAHQEKDNPSTEFHYDNLLSTVLNLFGAGTETTSSTIRYALSVLMKHKDIQEKMQEEINTVIGRDRCPSMEDRKSLPFTDAVIHEVQRFLDIVPFSLPHYALEDISFRGYSWTTSLFLNCGTSVIPFLHSVLKDEKQWATPFSFNPQHFLDQNGKFQKLPAFLPFSAGKRSCVGESLARMELFIFLVTLLQDFRFSCPGGPDSIDLIPEYSTFANVPRSYDIIATPL